VEKISRSPILCTIRKLVSLALNIIGIPEKKDVNSINRNSPVNTIDSRLAAPRGPREEKLSNILKKLLIARCNCTR
jgi:hypothetical protein